MFINIVFSKFQNLFKPIYNKSFVLQNLDRLIGLNIFLVIFSSLFAQSDLIGNFAVFAILLTIIKLLTKTGEKFEIRGADFFLLVYFIFILISVAGSSLFYLSFKGFLKTLTYFGFYVSLIHYLKDNTAKIKWIFISYVFCACYESVFAFLQHFGAVEEISGWQDMSHLNPEEVMTRVYGTLKPYNPNLFGGYMLAILPSFIVIPLLNKKLLPLIIFFAVLSGVALIFTGCRGAYIGLFAELIVIIGVIYKLLKPQLKKLFTYIVGAILGIISSLIIMTASIRARIISIFAMRNDSSNSFRFNVYNSCVQMFKDNWLFGIGCGNQNFREIYGLYMKTGFDALSAYNIYLEIAVESGIFALLSFVTYLIINIVKAFKYILLEKRGVAVVCVLSALVSIIGILMHGIVDTVFFRPQIQFVFWTMTAVIRIMIIK